MPRELTSYAGGTDAGDLDGVAPLIPEGRVDIETGDAVRAAGATGFGILEAKYLHTCWGDGDAVKGHEEHATRSSEAQGRRAEEFKGELRLGDKKVPGFKGEVGIASAKHEMIFPGANGTVPLVSPM